MKRVLAFTLWGDIPMYNVGAIQNAKHAIYIYPGFECWFYIHEPSVPKETVDQLRAFSHVRLFLRSDDLETSRPLMWRFEAIDDPEVEIVLSRDTDTRIWLREHLAVKEWIQSGKPFHIMRDHIYHTGPILAGMFGMRKLKEIPSWKDKFDQAEQSEQAGKFYDQIFLAKVVYPLIKDQAMIHASFHRNEPQAKPFPIPFCPKFNFVGEYVYADESRNAEHVKMLSDYVKAMESAAKPRRWGMM